MLRDGPGTPAARWFDVDWDAASGRVLLPVLGRPLEEIIGTFTVQDGELRAGDLRLPLAPGTEAMDVPALLGAQHYELIHWRRPERNVRRFFTIDALVAVCVEHTEVAAAVDTVPRLLVDHPAFGGVRVDHVDGLADPGGYLRQLRELLGDRWIVVEKILAPGETLPDDWPVDGTTGYEHARVLEHALLDERGWRAIAARWADIAGDGRPFRAWELEARHEVLDGGLRPTATVSARVAAAVVPDLEYEAARAPSPSSAPTSIGTARTFPTMSPDVWRWRQRGSRPQRLARISLDRSSMSAVRSRPPARARPPRCGPAGSS